MTPYANSKDSGIRSYEIGSDHITIKFNDGGIYLYNNIKPGSSHVAQMKQLAVSGHGLNTYINQHIRDNYYLQLE